MMLITGLLCLAMAGMMILTGHLLNRISHLEFLIESMNHDLNMIAHAKKNEKQILKGQAFQYFFRIFIENKGRMKENTKIALIALGWFLTIALIAFIFG